MRCTRLSLPVFCLLAVLRLLSAQTTSKVDFAKDVLPILRQNCVMCHSGKQAASGMRLDRRSAVINRRGVVPGSAENSFLFHRISGSDYGMQMPPTGALKPEQIDTIKRWIEQGADWPDALANETELPPSDPKAVAMVNALHEGDLAQFMKFAAEDAKLLNARGPEGSTPFMYAVLYTNAVTLERLLKLGADPNRRNDANATALMWAATEMDKTKVLLSHGADVNARSSDMRTPLMIAARKLGNSAVVKLLLDKGAIPIPIRIPPPESSPLLDAASAGNPESVEMLHRQRRRSETGRRDGDLHGRYRGVLQMSVSADRQRDRQERLQPGAGRHRHYRRRECRQDDARSRRRRKRLSMRWEELR